MIPIREFNTICQEMVDTIAGLEKHYLVAEEKQTVNKVKDESGPLLVCVIPSADRAGTRSASRDNNTTFFFALIKPGTDDDPDTELDNFELTQNLIESVESFLLDKQESGCNSFFNLTPSSMSKDPVYNTFGGFIGWSLAITF